MKKEETGWEELEKEMNDEMKKMAASYHSVKIPDELREKVLESIKKGKAEAAEAKALKPGSPAAEAQEIKAQEIKAQEIKTQEIKAQEIKTQETKTQEIKAQEIKAQEIKSQESKAQESKVRITPKTKTSGGKSMAKRILLRSGQTAAAALIAMTVLANSGPEIAYAMGRIPVVGAITRVVTFRTYEKQEGKTEAKVEVPKVEAESGSGIDQAASEINRSVEEYTDRLIAQFEADVQAEGGEANHGLYSNYEVVTDNERLFTLRINVDEIMASAAGSVKIYNVDKKTDKIIALKDLFPAGTDYVTLLSDAVKEQMKAEMARDENKIYFLNDGEESDFKAIKEDQNFYINGEGRLVLVFDEYEVAPGYMGVVEIEVPGDVFQF